MNKRIYIKPKFVEMDARYSESLLQASADNERIRVEYDDDPESEGTIEAKKFDDDWEEWE